MISILCPTRKRPTNLTRFVDSILGTAKNIQDIELVVYVDDDDEESVSALSTIAEKINVNAVQGNRLIGSQMYNELFKMATGDIIMFAADDIVFKTPNWDVYVTTEFNKVEDKILLIFGDDGIQNGRIATHGFVHRYWVELIGYGLPPKLASAYTDEWITEVAIRIGRCNYLPNFIVEHMHPAVGKAPMDDVYKDRIEVTGDIVAYYKSLEGDRVADAAKLQAFIDLFK